MELAKAQRASLTGLAQCSKRRQHGLKKHGIPSMILKQRRQYSCLCGRRQRIQMHTCTSSKAVAAALTREKIVRRHAAMSLLYCWTSPKKLVKGIRRLSITVEIFLWLAAMGT